MKLWLTWNCDGNRIRELVSERRGLASECGRVQEREEGKKLNGRGHFTQFYLRLSVLSFKNFYDTGLSQGFPGSASGLLSFGLQWQHCWDDHVCKSSQKLWYLKEGVSRGGRHLKLGFFFGLGDKKTIHLPTISLRQLNNTLDKLRRSVFRPRSGFKTVAVKFDQVCTLKWEFDS